MDFLLKNQFDKVSEKEIVSVDAEQLEINAQRRIQQRQNRIFGKKK